MIPFRIAASVLALAAGAAQAADFAHCKGVAYISVAKEGTVSVNGAPTDLSLLGETVSRTSSRFVFYYHAGPPAPRVQEVTDAVMRLRKPLSMSSKSDFSDTIDAGGVSHPRTACPEQG